MSHISRCGPMTQHAVKVCLCHILQDCHCVLRAFVHRYKACCGHAWARKKIPTCLCRICAAIEIIAHSDSWILIRKFYESLIPVGSNIELGLYKAAKRLSQFHKLLMCSLIWQVSDMQHLQQEQYTVSCSSASLCIAIICSLHEV